MAPRVGGHLSLTTPEYGPLNWRALVDVQTDSVLSWNPWSLASTAWCFTVTRSPALAMQPTPQPGQQRAEPAPQLR